MICSKCGQECDDDVKFCTNCGAELSGQETPVEETPVENVVEEKEEETETVEEKTEDAAAEENAEEVKEVSKPAENVKSGFDFAKNKKLLITIGAAAAAVLVFILIVVALCSGKSPYMEISDKSVLQVVNDGDSIFARLANGSTVVLDSDAVTNTRFSMDRTTLAFMNSDEELVVVADGKLKNTGIDDARGVKVSTEGNTLLYFSDYELASYQTVYGYNDTIGVGTLHLYYVKNGKDIKIADDVVIGSAVLSPNGETVAYVSDYDGTDDFKGYYSVNGKKSVEFGKEKRIFAIADKAAYVYYADDDRIYVQKGKKEAEKLATDMYGTNVLLNADCSEMLYISDGKTYITVNAGEKKKVSGERFTSVLLNNTAVSFEDFMDAERGDITVTYTGVDTFKGNLFYTGAGEIMYMKSNYETEKVVSRAWSFAVADDGKSLVFINGEDISKVTNFDKGGVKTDISDDAEVSSIYADGNLKYVYYVNDDEELYCINGKKAKKIADDVTSVSVSADGEICYYVVDREELYYSSKAGKGKELLSKEDTRMSCSSSYGYNYVAVRDGSDVEVFLLDGKKMKLIYSYED